jgi:hypothetical protein
MPMTNNLIVTNCMSETDEFRAVFLGKDLRLLL